MVRWSQPPDLYLLSGFVALMVLRFGMNIIDIVGEGPLALVFGVIIVLTVSFMLYYVVRRSLGDLYDHEMSYWKMEEDQVVMRIDAAMRARGVQVAVERKGDRVWFPLPPLSVVVAPGWWRTRIYVGPSTDETELLVERLENFVERTLA